MVKGVSKQVIVVNSPDKKMFDQAIFILSDDAVKGAGVTDQMLLREARELMRNPQKRNNYLLLYKFGYGFLGALCIGVIWIITAILSLA